MDPERIASSRDVLQLHQEHPQGPGIAPLHGKDLPPEMGVPGQLKGGALDQVTPSPPIMGQGKTVPVVIEEDAVPQRDSVSSQDRQKESADTPEAHPTTGNPRARPPGGQARVMLEIDGVTAKVS